MLTESHLYREIHQQPAVVESLLGREGAMVRRLAEAIQQRGVDHVVIAARGTSDNAARYAKYILGAQNGLQVALATPSLFTLYQKPPRFGNALVLGISQSGKSPDIVAVLAEARRQGKLTAVITNTLDSPLAQEADFVLDLGCGREQAVAATKTYTASLAAIALLSAEMAGSGERLEELQHIPAAMQAALAVDGAVSTIAPRYRYMEQSVVIGRGYNYATAFELALKLKELTYTVVEPYSSADFMHGPLAMIAPGFPVLVLAPSGPLLPELQDFIKNIGERQAEVIVISDDPETVRLARIGLQLPPGVPDWLSPLVTIIPGQLLAMHLAHERGLNVDAPRAIHKVTETQ